MSRYTDTDVSNKKLPPLGAYWAEDLVSFERSLRPLESQMKELNRTIKNAKQSCRSSSDHGLTQDESAAIYLYTMEGGNNSFYRSLNKTLRTEDRRAAIPWFPYLKLLDTAFQKLPTVKKNVWRGVPGNVGNQFKRGQELVWWSVSSCSTDIDVIKQFLGPKSTLFMIECRTGKDISTYTNYPKEREVVLLPGTELRVIGTLPDASNTLHIVHLEEIESQKSDEPDIRVNIIREYLIPLMIVQYDGLI